MVLFCVNISLGSISIPFKTIVSSFFTATDSLSNQEYIIQNYRLPKAITAVLVGSGLGISGLLMQTLFRNPLAGPFVLGITSGASLGVALVILGSSIFGGFLAGVFGGFSTAADFIEGVRIDFVPFHVAYAFIKTMFFAFIIATVPSFHGYYMKGGALEVGKASTTSFVWTAVVIITTNYILTQLLLG